MNKEKEKERVKLLLVDCRIVFVRNRKLEIGEDIG